MGSSDVTGDLHVRISHVLRACDILTPELGSGVLGVVVRGGILPLRGELVTEVTGMTWHITGDRT